MSALHVTSFCELNVDCINNIITSRWTTFYRIHTVFLLSFFCKKQVFLPMGSCWFRCEPVFRDSGPLHLNWFCDLFNFVPMSPPIGLRQMFIREMNCSYMKNRLYKLHGKLLSLSCMKFQALSSKSMVFIAKPCWTFVSKQKLSSKSMVFIAKPCWTFVSKQKLDKIMLFVQWKFCSKSLKLWFKLPHNNSRKVHENKKLNWHISLALL